MSESSSLFFINGITCSGKPSTSTTMPSMNPNPGTLVPGNFLNGKNMADECFFRGLAS